MAGITVDISGRLVNAKEILDSLQKTMNQLDLDSSFGKHFKALVDSARELYEKSMKNTERTITNSSGIAKINTEVDNIYKKLQSAVSLFQELQFKDLNIKLFSQEIKTIEENINNLQVKMNSISSDGIRDWVNSSEDLKKVLQDAGLSFDKLTSKNVGNVLISNAEKAKLEARSAKDEYKKFAEAVNETEREIQSLQQKKEQIGAHSRINGLMGQASQQMKLSGPAGETITTERRIDLIQNIVKTADELKKLTGHGYDVEISKVFQPLINASSQVHTIKELGLELINLRKSLKSLTDINGEPLLKEKQLRSVVNANYLGPQAEKHYFPDQKVTKQYYDNLNEVLTSGKNAGIFKESDELNKLIENIQKKTITVDEAYKKVREVIKINREALNTELNSKEIERQSRMSALETAESNLLNAAHKAVVTNEQKRSYTNENNNLLVKIANLEQQIQSLNEELNALKNEKVLDVKNKNIPAEGKIKQSFEESLILAQKYNNQLDQIKERQKLVGKIEGLVQRWFSIYTVVRMVNKAINQIKTTLKELDKTITEIAIVTDMTQKDLWSQMDSYTRMARQYGASISGVYKVSQLFYQQGLQTNEVMTLTEQTLKMARISGLEYADATDYMTNALRSFKMEMSEAQTIVDVYSAIAASSATSTKELAQAMSKTASSAESVGSSFENTTAMMAVMIDNTVPYNRKIILNPEYAGNSLELFLLNQYSDILAA